MRLPDGTAIVSVVIPCLNEEEPIAGVVTEVLAQGADEVIVVDNGSTDATAERAAAMAAPARRDSRRCGTMPRSSVTSTVTAATFRLSSPRW